MLVIVFWQACSPNPHGSMSLMNDKVLHVITFLVLGIWGQLGWSRYPYRIRLLGFLVFYGIAIECVQYLVPGRFFSLMDWLMDILGLGISVLLTTLYLSNGQIKISRLKSRYNPD